MMLLDSKMPVVPSGLKAAGTVPKGCADRNASVLIRLPPLKPTRPARAAEAYAPFSSAERGLASKSHSQFVSSEGFAPRTSRSTPLRRAAIVAFQILGLGR